MNLLIVKLSAVGDVVHTLPCLAALRRHDPQAHISWVVEEAAADLLQGHPLLDALIVSGRKRWIAALRRGRIRETAGEMRRFLRRLRERPYDLVIDFHGLLKSALLVGLSRGIRRLGYDSMQELSGLFLTERIPEDMGKHAVDRYLDLVRHLGVEVGKPVFPIPATAANEARAARLLSAHGIDPAEPFVAISPEALWPTKGWPPERFARLAERIHRETGVPVAFTGKDASCVQPILAGVAVPVANLAGETGLRDLACVFRRAAIVVTPDSGPMHIAAAVGTPVAALFGPTNPVRTGPYGRGHEVIRTAVPCSPCYRKTCETGQCMREITVERVFAAVAARLKPSPGGMP